ncbi:hypothetical protein KC220_25275, partial [Mycobacterium tuberculosis]|nr:hypothetical protein [Mycobacterium tuberculosis]
LAVLADGRIRGAGLDVFDTEPLPGDHPMRRAPRTVLTPHLGYVTEETYRVFFPMVVGGLGVWVAGGPMGVVRWGCVSSGVVRLS